MTGSITLSDALANRPGWAEDLLTSVFGLFLLKQSLEEIPLSFNEAAHLDGAGHFRISWSVIQPNVHTLPTTLSLITFLFSWNAFLWPLVAIQSLEKQVVCAALATIPLIILFLFLQRFFVLGIATSGLK